MKENITPFEAIGGEEGISLLVDTFYYNYVAKHPDLSLVFPDDLTETARKQKQFFTQFLGGPPLYSEEHGPPMLRRRHLPFVITNERKEAWLACMEKAMDEVKLEGPIREYFFERLSMAAQHMVNHPST